MISLINVVGYLLSTFGVVAILGGLASLNLTPLILGGILSGLGGVLLLLVRLERRLSAALPALDTLAQTASFLARKESLRAPVTDSALDTDTEPPGARLRPGLSGAVDAYPERGGPDAARA